MISSCWNKDGIVILSFENKKEIKASLPLIMGLFGNFFLVSSLRFFVQALVLSMLDAMLTSVMEQILEVVSFLQL